MHPERQRPPSRPLYTPEERVRRDATVWTLVQGILAPVQFLVFLVSLGLVLRHPLLTMFVFLATVILNIHLYVTIPKGFFPQQDTGRIMGGIRADQSISFQAMRRKFRQFVEIVRSDPAIESVAGFTGL